jgi:hypothetical protein
MPNGGVRQERCFLMDEPTFSVLIPKLPGKLPLEWLIKYTQAFAAMKAHILGAAQAPIALTRAEMAKRNWELEVEIEEREARQLISNTIIGEQAVQIAVKDQTLEFLNGNAESMLIEDYINSRGLFHKPFREHCRRFEVGGYENCRERSPRAGKQSRFEKVEDKYLNADSGGKEHWDTHFTKITPYGVAEFDKELNRGELNHFIKTDLRVVK